MSTYIRGGGVAYTDAIIVSQAVINEVESNTIVLSDPTSSNYTKLTPTIDSSGTDLLQIKAVNIETGEDAPIQRLEINSILSGINPTASAPGAATFGINNIASNTGSFVEGVGTLATGFAAHAAGFNTTSSGYAAFSMGIETDADGTASFTAGSGSWARGDSSVAMGIGTIASASGQVTIGHFNFPLNTPDHLFVVGGGTGSATSARGNLLEVYGGIGSTYKAVKIDVGSTFTQTSSPPQGFSIYGNTTFQGNISGSVRVGGSNIILNDDTVNLINATSSFSIRDIDSLTYATDVPKIAINRFGINFQNLDLTTSPGSTYLWANNFSRLFYGSNAIILNDGNTLGSTMTIGTNDINNLQLETNNTTRVFISSSGNVGIGTTTPTQPLEIVNASNPQLRIRDGASGGNLDLRSSGAGEVRIQYAGGGYVAAEGSALRVFAQGAAGLALETNGTTKPVEIKPNGTTRLIVSASGNVGIGTSTPSARLHISGANNEALLIASSPSAPSALFVSGSGRVGIGTTSPQFKLHVLGTAGGDATFNGGILVENNNATDGEAALAFRVNSMAAASNYWFTGINQSNNYDIAYGTSFTNANTALSINANLRIGIGTMSPSARLQVRGEGATSSTTALRVENSSAAARLTILDDGTSAFNTSHLYVSSSGNIGIGTTNPTSRLHIGPLTGGDGTAQERLRLTGDWTSVGSGALLRFTNQHDSGTTPNTGEYNLAGIAGVDDNANWGGSLYFYTSPTGTTGGANLNTRMIINASGNVGIGTTSPSVRLHVSGTSATNELVYLTGDASQGSAIRFNRGSSYSWRMGVTNASNFTIEDTSYSTARFQISHTSGLVGINTTSPNARLHISGANNEALLIVSSSTAPSALFVSGSGNVGIGTAIPTYKLDVSGSAQFYKTTSDYIQLLQDVNSITFSPNVPSYLKYDSTPILSMKSGGGNSTIVHGAGTAILAATSTGVSIRTNVDGAVATSMLQVRGSGTTSATTALRVENSNATARLTILDDGTSAFNTSHLYVSSSGRVGIGTTTPVHNLVVDGTTGISINAGGATFPNIHRDSSDGGMLLRSWNGSTFTNNVKITPTSNVGIGTTSPSASLHVQGNLQISTGSLYTYGQNTDIDSGSIRTVMSVATGSYRAAFFDYVLNKSTNARAGTVFSVWNGTSVEWNDVSTNDIGNTTEVNLSVGLSGANVVLYASSSTNDWSMKALSRML